MGEVYRAEDTRLKRQVAIKVLPEPFTRDAERLARFEREAQLLASLNHPNIAAIYGLEESDLVRFLVLELVEGETLSERVRRGPLPLQEALDIARQMAEGLEAAHEKGVLHRDLKPANIKITPEGKVKILDFGLAKALQAEAGAADLAQSLTLTGGMTQGGVILGTAAYMSPEQARGKTVDRRTDVWAFGCVVFEMLAGRPAFSGETITEIVGGILKGEPDWSGLPGGTPPAVAAILRRCLQKDAGRRYRSAADVNIAIEDSALNAAVAQLTAAGADRAARRQRAVPLTLAVVTIVAAAVIAGIAGWTFRPEVLQSIPGPVTRFTLNLPPGQQLGDFTWPIIALSPDGSLLAYVSRRENGLQQIFLRPMNNLQSRPLEDTVGATSAFFSPDGQWIGFYADGRVKKISVDGGSAQQLAEISTGRGFSWGNNDLIYAGVATSGIFRMPAAGGVPERLVTPGGSAALGWPDFLPHGKALLYAGSPASSNWDRARITAFRLDSGDRLPLLEGTFPRHSPTGHLLYVQRGTLMAVPFDPLALKTGGPAVPVVEGVAQSSFGSGQFSLAQTGTLVYVAGGLQADHSRLVRVDRSGGSQPLAAPLRSYQRPRLSPDGRRLAVDSDGDIWVYEMARDTLTRLTFDGSNDLPAWTSIQTDNATSGFYLWKGSANRFFFWARVLTNRPPVFLPTAAGWLMCRMNRAATKSMCSHIRVPPENGRFPRQGAPNRSGGGMDGSISAAATT